MRYLILSLVILLGLSSHAMSGTRDPKTPDAKHLAYGELHQCVVPVRGLAKYPDMKEDETASFFGSLILRKTESVISRIPLIKVFYKTIKQIIETIFKNNSNAFRDVVLLEYPRKGVWVLGFTTGEVKGILNQKIKQKSVNVFVPTTPNPTSGFLLMVPKSQLKYLNTNVDDAVKTIVSAGIINLNPKQKDN